MIKNKGSQAQGFLLRLFAACFLIHGKKNYGLSKLEGTLSVKKHKLKIMECIKPGETAWKIKNWRLC